MGWAITWAPIPFSHDENDLRRMGLMAVGRSAKTIEALNDANRHHLVLSLLGYPSVMVAKLRVSLCKIICFVIYMVDGQMLLLLFTSLARHAFHSLEIDFVLAAYLEERRF